MTTKALLLLLVLIVLTTILTLQLYHYDKARIGEFEIPFKINKITGSTYTYNLMDHNWQYHPYTVVDSPMNIKKAELKADPSKPNSKEDQWKDIPSGFVPSIPVDRRTGKQIENLDGFPRDQIDWYVNERKEK